MNTEVIIAALIAAIASVIGNIIVRSSERKKDAIERAARDTRLDMKLSEIDRKLDSHNHYAERIGSVEMAIVAIKTAMESIKEDLHDLKK